MKHSPITIAPIIECEKLTVSSELIHLPPRKNIISMNAIIVIVVVKIIKGRCIANHSCTPHILLDGKINR